jgi:hypothetical protein
MPIDLADDLGPVVRGAQELGAPQTSAPVSEPYQLNATRAITVTHVVDSWLENPFQPIGADERIASILAN